MSRGLLPILGAVMLAGVAVGALLAALSPSPAAPVARLDLPSQGSGAQAQSAAAGSPPREPLGGAATPAQGGAAGQEREQLRQRQGTPEERLGPLAGSVVSVEGDIATVGTPQGEVKVKLSGARIQRTVDGTVEDVKPGLRVLVSAQPGADGVYSASTVQIVPANQPPAQPTPGTGSQPSPSAGSSPGRTRAP